MRNTLYKAKHLVPRIIRGNKKPACFVLGLGAQKSGTSWISRYMRTDPSTAGLKSKSFFVWDALHVPELAYFDLRSGSATAALSKDQRDLRLRMLEDPEVYFDYFAARLKRYGISLVSDMSPSYSSLPVEALARIQAGFRHRGIEVKCILSMRDPVDRCWSALQMYRNKGHIEAAREQGVDLSLPEDEAFRTYVDSRQAQIRTNYHVSLDRALEIFAPEDLHVCSFETMFTDPEIERLSKFLGIRTNTSFARRKVNLGRRKRTLPPEVATYGRQRFSPVYDAICNRYPSIHETWSHAFAASSKGNPKQIRE